MAISVQPFGPKYEQHRALADRYIVGGVSSMARLNAAFNQPIYIQRGEGAHVWDLDGNRYIDINIGYGCALLGHGHPAVQQAVTQAAAEGFLCAQENRYPALVAAKLSDMIPSMEQMRFGCTGMDATMYAVRLARFVTGRPEVVRFEGHGHGMSDATLSGGVRPPSPDTPDDQPLPVEAVFRGLIPDSEKPVIILPWNDPEVLEKTLRKRGHDIAAVIMEPVNMSMGVVWPAPGYLETVRALTQELGIVLIFDEILCGFRTGPGCMQEQLGVRPDLTTLGKALGGGVPVSCLGGRRQLMQHLRPVGECAHSGTFFGHGVALAAALAFLTQITKADFYTHLENLEGYFYPRLREIFARRGLAVRLITAGSQFGLFFTEQDRIDNWRAYLRCDQAMALRYYRHLLHCGVYVNPPAVHHSLCAALTQSDLDELLDRMDTAAAKLARETV